MKGKRRWIEWGKTLLILLLSASAIYLLSMTPLIQDSGVLEWLEPGQTSTEGSTSVTLTAAARPSRIVISNGKERYGSEYDQSDTDALFTTLGSLMGGALVSAQEPQQIPENRWQRYIQGAGIYFDFTGDIPLSALSSWLQPSGACSLSASARRLMLVHGQGDEVLLCYQDLEDGQFYACLTELSWELHLEPAVRNVSGNNVVFAFEGEEWAKVLYPYTLITEEHIRAIYNASTPLMSGGNLTDLLEALDYTGRNHASVSGGSLYLDGNDRLLVMSSGKVEYEAAQSGKYLVPTTGNKMTVAEAIEAARKLAENTIGQRSGEAELYLDSARAVDGGYEIRFGYRLDGSTVWLYDEGWAAEFLVQDDCITRFTLHFRNYTSTGEAALLLPIDRAAVMIPVLGKENCEPILQYQDRGESSVSPMWTAK